MPRIVVITTGGTIATSADPAGVLRPSLSGADLVEGLGTEVVDLLALDSSELTPLDWLLIGSAVSAAATDGADGIVVTHGTDTMEETALWLDLTYGGDAPVVLTGSSRAADAADADGPANLRDALTVAASPHARELGVLMSFAGAVLAPLGTTKLGGAQVFGATAQVGTVSQGTFEITTPKERPYLGQVTSAPRVDIAAAYPGADGTAIDSFTAAGARGVVIEAMGSGNAGASLIDAVARACRRGVAVAITSRVPGGHARPTYGPGADLVAAGAVMAPRLRAGQARVLLMAALGAGLPVESTVSRWG